jgi:hypothetical protein
MLEDSSIDVPFDHDDGDDEWDEENNDLIYLKYMFEGAASVGELSASLRQLADGLDRQAAEGWSMAGPVDGGHVHLVREVGD